MEWWSIAHSMFLLVIYQTESVLRLFSRAWAAEGRGASSVPLLQPRGPRVALQSRGLQLHTWQMCHFSGYLDGQQPSTWRAVQLHLSVTVAWEALYWLREACILQGKLVGCDLGARMPLPSLAPWTIRLDGFITPCFPNWSWAQDIITKLHFNLNGNFLACNQDGNSRYQQRSSVEILQDERHMSFAGEHYFYANWTQ